MRGLSPFSPETLQDGMSAFASDGPVAPALVADYYRFYDLDLPAEFAGLEHRMGWIEVDEYRIASQLFTLPESRGTVVVCHGYYDHVGLYGHLLRFLLSEGFCVLSFDQPGHGLSSGPRASIGSFDSYVDVLVSTIEAAAPVLPQPWHIVGQSMGGAVAMEYLLRDGAREFAEIFLLAPLVRPAAWPLNRIAYEIARRTVTERKRTITDNADNPEFLALMRSDPLAPDTLPVQWVTAMVDWMRRFERRSGLPFQPKIVQGLADTTVGWRYNLRLLKRLSEPEILELPGARHHLVNETPEIRAQMFAWIARRLP